MTLKYPNAMSSEIFETFRAIFNSHSNNSLGLGVVGGGGGGGGGYLQQMAYNTTLSAGLGGSGGVSTGALPGAVGGVDLGSLELAHFSDDTYNDVLKEFHETLFTHREPHNIVLICLYVPIFLMAFLGNLLVLVVVLPNRHMRNMTNCFMVNLAVADLLVTLVCMPMAIGQGVYRVWVYGEFMCKTTAYMQGVSVAASVFTIMTLSVDRYFAIRHPMTFRRLCSVKYAWKIVLLIWIVSLGIMVPLILAKTIQKVEFIPMQTIEFCSEIWWRSSHRSIYDVCLFILMFVVPGCFITTSYSLIGRQLWTENTHLYRTDSKVGKMQAEKVMAGRRRVARILVILAILFGLCWLPSHILSIYLDFVGETFAPGALDALPFTLLMGHSNSALNPILYYFMNKSFRKFFVRTFKCRNTKTRKRTKETPPVNLVAVYTPANNSTRISRKRPLLRVLSSSQSTGSRSTTGSMRNASIKSQQTSSMVLTSNANPDHHQRRPYGSMACEERIPRYTFNSRRKRLVRQDREEHSIREGLLKKHKEILNLTLSIPNTINEESSRFRLTPEDSLTGSHTHCKVECTITANRWTPGGGECAVEDNRSSSNNSNSSSAKEALVQAQIEKEDPDVKLSKEDSGVKLSKEDSDVKLSKEDSDVKLSKEESDVKL